MESGYDELAWIAGECACNGCLFALGFGYIISGFGRLDSDWNKTLKEYARGWTVPGSQKFFGFSISTVGLRC